MSVIKYGKVLHMKPIEEVSNSNIIITLLFVILFLI